MDKSQLKTAHLRRIKSLALLDDAQLTTFLEHVEVIKYPYSGTVFGEGQKGDSMFLILDGECRIFSKQRGGEILFLRILESGEAFGEIALLSGGPRSASVEATKESILLKISAASLETLRLEDPALAAQFLHHLARSLGRQLNDLTKRLRAGREMKDLVTFIQ